ncbi:MAG TPA: hypothetical protein DD671_00140, partial [Balneolaceae bacterium]|nr:hypothetical protein [Balneolaceae bacterium]
MSSIQNLFQQTNPYEKFVVQLVELESQQKYKLEAQRDTQDEQKKALGDVSSSISEFISKIDEISEPNNKPFSALSTESSDESIVRMNSATGISRESNYNLDIERIATRDTQLSQLTIGSA